MEATLQTEQKPLEYPINASNAREMAKKRWDAWKERKNAEIVHDGLEKVKQETARIEQSINPLHARYLRQLDDLDKEWKTAKARDRRAIAQAQALIHGLLFAKPKASRQRSAYQHAEPIETPPGSPPGTQ